MFTEFSCIYANAWGDCTCKDNDIPFCQREFFCDYYENCDYCTDKGSCRHLGHSGSGIKCADESR